MTVPTRTEQINFRPCSRIFITPFDEWLKPIGPLPIKPNQTPNLALIHTPFRRKEDGEQENIAGGDLSHEQGYDKNHSQPSKDKRDQNHERE